MTEYENEQIKHQVYLEQYKNSQSNKIVSLLDTSNKRIAEYIKKTDGVYTKARYKEISKRIKELSKSLKESVDNGTDIDSIIEYELNKQIKLSKTLTTSVSSNSVINFNFLYPTLEQVKISALFKPIVDNMTYQSYLESIENGLYNVWDSHIRTGYLTGQTTKQIVKEVLGSVAGNAKVAEYGAMNSFRNSVYMNTRTVLQAFANETRNQVFEKNEKYFGDKYGNKYEYLSTLDTRSCLVCSFMDGKRFKSLKDAPSIPMHRNCRCLILNIPSIEIEEDTRASKDGQVSSKITYEEWLKNQDEKIQKDILGDTRYKLFKKGERITTFINNNKMLSLKELYEKLDYQDVIELGFKTGKSVGAMARRFYVKVGKNVTSTDDFEWRIKDNTEVTGVKVIAQGDKIKSLERLINQYPLQNGELTSPKDWYKVRGTGILVSDTDKKVVKAEIHWYQCKDIGKIEFKVKRLYNES